jgi:hypothetical protein
LKGKYLEEYMVLNMKTGNGKVVELRTRRDKQRRKYSKMDKVAKDKLLGHLERMEKDRMPK